MIGVANLVCVLGSVLMLVEIYLEGKLYNLRAVTSYVNIVMFILLTIAWFYFAHSTMSTSNNELMAYSLAIGVLLFIAGICGLLKCFSAVRN